MNHLGNDMLLAYVRQQQLYLWSSEMQEHLAHCSVCQGRCAEYAQISGTIETWAHPTVRDAKYTTVATNVLRKLYEEKPSFSQHIRHGIARVRVGLPIVMVLAILFVLLFTVANLYILGGTKTFGKPSITPTTPAHILTTPIPRQPTATPIPPSPTAIAGGAVTVTPTVKSVVPGSTVTPTTADQPHIETNAPCTTLIDAIEKYLHVCGKNFTAGATVTIEYQIGSISEKHSTLVNADGTFIDLLYIRSCKDIPTAIYVQSSASPSEMAQIVKNIVFGTCQSFGKLRK